jgi:hypothetical protein
MTMSSTGSVVFCGPPRRCSASIATSPTAADTPLRIPSFSWFQAARYIVCMRRVNETPETRGRRPLKTLIPLEPLAGVVKSCSTAVAEAPCNPNLVMIFRAMTSS